MKTLIAFAVAAASHAAEGTLPVAPPTSTQRSDEVQVVNVAGVRAEPLKRYRSMLAGVRAFDKLKPVLGPEAALSFQLVPANADEGAPFPTDIRLSLLGEKTSLQIPVTTDGLFSLPVPQEVNEDDPELTTNQKKGSVLWRADVRSPGVSAGVRRLGDLRLECAANTEIIKTEAPWAARMALGLISLGGDWCSITSGKYSFPAPKRLKAVYITSGERRAELEHWGTGYNAPVGDTAWPNNALVEFSFNPATTPP